MKKKKITYSLTAKERKAMRRGEPEKKEAEKVEQPQVDAEGVALEGEEAVNTKSKMTPKQLAIMFTGIALGLVIILTAFLVGFLVKQSSSKYPRAIITLNDGRKIEMVIWEEDCPIMASNFIFLAKIGFFDGTIIYDVEPNREFMRFGAYKGYGKGETRYEDANFISKIDKKIFNITNVSDASDRTKAESAKFGYRLYKDDYGVDKYGNEFVVSANYSDAADFVINLGENNTSFTNQNGTTSLNNNLCAFARIEDKKSQDVVRSIYERDDIVATELTFGTSNIYAPATPVVIKSVKLTNLNKKKWKDFEFVSYMNTAYKNKTSAFRQWVA